MEKTHKRCSGRTRMDREGLEPTLPEGARFTAGCASTRAFCPEVRKMRCRGWIRTSNLLTASGSAALPLMLLGAHPRCNIRAPPVKARM